MQKLRHVSKFKKTSDLKSAAGNLPHASHYTVTSFQDQTVHRRRGYTSNPEVRGCQGGRSSQDQLENTREPQTRLPTPTAAVCEQHCVALTSPFDESYRMLFAFIIE